MVKTLKALFANSMLMFRLMFFHNKKTRRSRFYHAAMSFFRHISGKLALTSASAKGGGTALPQRATCLSLAHFTLQKYMSIMYRWENPDPRRFSV
ncbi:TPA: hypothetical protein MYN72_004689 [Klebsiella pneumoniae]|nr:hypothetical protein [Klebsiella pneumoniae]